MTQVRRLSRRDFLRVAATAATGALIAACAPSARETAQVVEEAPGQQPAATQVPSVEQAAPTAAPVPTTVPPTATPTVEEVQGAVDPFIAKVADVPHATAFDFKWDEKPAIVINLEGEYNAFRNVCTHNGCQTRYYGGTSLDCPCHGSRFDAATGEAIRGPAETRLRRIDVVVEDDNILVAV